MCVKGVLRGVCDGVCVMGVLRGVCACVMALCLFLGNVRLFFACLKCQSLFRLTNQSRYDKVNTVKISRNTPSSKIIYHISGYRS